MRPFLRAGAIAVLVLACVPVPLFAAETLPGATVEGLLALARQNNPEYASMRFEAQAANERVLPAGALPDPKLRTEWMDVTKGGSQAPTLWPVDTGSTKYTLMQDLPWFGKRDLKRAMAGFDAEGAQGRAQATWAELAAKIKTAQAQRNYLYRNQVLTQELLDLIGRLEKIAQARYAGGLAMQQDVIRAQMEQTAMRTELVALHSEGAQADVRLNALLARNASDSLAVADDARDLPTPAQLDGHALAERVRKNNPQLFSEAARVKSAEKARELTLRNRYPDFVVSISPTQTQSAVPEWSVMLELNIPLQQSSRRAQEREAQAMLDAARARTEAVANQVLSDLSQNLAALEAARRTESLATSSLLPQAELTFQSALASYENGKLDFATLLDAQRQVRQARLARIKANLEAQMRLADIEKLLGEEV